MVRAAKMFMIATPTWMVAVLGLTGCVTNQSKASRDLAVGIADMAHAPTFPDAAWVSRRLSITLVKPEASSWSPGNDDHFEKTSYAVVENRYGIREIDFSELRSDKLPGKHLTSLYIHIEAPGCLKLADVEREVGSKFSAMHFKAGDKNENRLFGYVVNEAISQETLSVFPPDAKAPCVDGIQLGTTVYPMG